MAVQENKAEKKPILTSKSKSDNQVSDETISLLDSLCSDSSYLSYFNEFLTRFEPSPDKRVRDSRKLDFK